jgi:hypothetical protein
VSALLHWLGYWLLLCAIAASVLASLFAWGKHRAEREAQERWREIEGQAHPLPWMPSASQTTPAGMLARAERLKSRLERPISNAGHPRGPSGRVRT